MKPGRRNTVQAAPPPRRGVLAWAIVLASAALACAAPAHAATPPPGALDSTGSTLPAPRVVIPREGCVTTECHPGVKARSYLHGPLRVNACESCHKLDDAVTHRFQPTQDGPEACSLCHTPEIIPGATQHAPYAQGQCLACHDPHASDEPRMLRGRRYADSCTSCHPDPTAHDRVHGPAAIGACGACHQPHASTFPKLLNAEGRDLCLKCHVRTGLEIDSKSAVHAPALGDCRLCHQPHATDTAALLATDQTALCTQCHKEIAHTVSTASTQHAAITTKRGCTNCHAPHAADHAPLLKEESKTLCFECHNQPIAMPDGTRLVNMKKLIETGTSLHGALTQRGCAECHQIHGSDHRRLLVNEYPSELYYPFTESSYALCFSCHDRQLVLEATTSSATAFRNGADNLHFTHVNRAKNGRTCRTCHDAHAANHDKHIRDNVAFGPKGWKLPIRFEALPDGGRCGGACHAPYEYNRVNPLIYRAPPPGGAWNGSDLIPGARAEPPKPGPAPGPSASPSRSP